MEAYTYLPLPATNYIQLLRLLPGFGEAEVQCELLAVDLSYLHSEYQALSYVWGDSKIRRDITVDVNRLHVTTNLHAALIRLRRGWCFRLLWIDAICIDQAYFEERATQVERMAVIYALSSCVLVWLGPEQNGRDHAMELLRRPTVVPRYSSHAILSMVNLVNEKKVMPLEYSRDVDALQQLMSRSWFSRSWFSSMCMFQRTYN
jgi:hypothetical protein